MGYRSDSIAVSRDMGPLSCKVKVKNNPKRFLGKRSILVHLRPPTVPFDRKLLHNASPPRAPPPFPNLLFLAFLDFLAFFFCKESLAFLLVFPFFPRNFRGSEERKNPCFFGGFPCLFPKKQGKEDQGFSIFPNYPPLFASDSSSPLSQPPKQKKNKKTNPKHPPSTIWRKIIT